MKRGKSSKKKTTIVFTFLVLLLMLLITSLTMYVINLQTQDELEEKIKKLENFLNADGMILHLWFSNVEIFFKQLSVYFTLSFIKLINFKLFAFIKQSTLGLNFLCMMRDVQD